MAVIRRCWYDKKTKQKCYVKYDTDRAIFICNVPEGKLYKKPRKFNFYIYNPRGETNKEKIREVPYPEAKQLVKTHGTKEQYCEYFTIMNADGTYKEDLFHIRIDQVHKVKLQRTASMLSLSTKDCLEYLIDKYDDMRHYNKSFIVHKKNHRSYPADLSEFSE